MGMSKKHETPQFVKDYWAWMQAGPPKCCHTCGHYEPDGQCYKFHMEPPEQFAATPGECTSWKPEIPF
jgi:hypothetical protein